MFLGTYNLKTEDLQKDKIYACKSHKNYDGIPVYRVLGPKNLRAIWKTPENTTGHFNCKDWYGWDFKEANKSEIEFLNNGRIHLKTGEAKEYEGNYLKINLSNGKEFIQYCESYSDYLMSINGPETYLGGSLFGKTYLSDVDSIEYANIDEIKELHKMLGGLTENQIDQIFVEHKVELPKKLPQNFIVVWQTTFNRSLWSTTIRGGKRILKHSDEDFGPLDVKKKLKNKCKFIEVIALEGTKPIRYTWEAFSTEYPEILEM